MCFEATLASFRRKVSYSVFTLISPVRTHPRLVKAAMLAAHAEGFDGRRRLICHQQSLLQLDLLLQLHQHRRLHPVPAETNRAGDWCILGTDVSNQHLHVKHLLGDDASDLQQTETNLPRLLVQH